MKKITSILLVDDDLDDREIFSEAISAVDDTIKVEFAVNGIEALKQLQSGNVKPDVIFSDINMPLMNGMQLLEEISKLSGLKMLPFIMYTTSSSKDYQLQSQKFGAQYYIVKPNSFEKICSEIRCALDKIAQLSRRSFSFQSVFSVNQLR